MLAIPVLSLIDSPGARQAVAVTVIGLVTFVLSFVAVLIGYRIGTRFRRPAEILGGLVLIGIGTQILIEHLSA